MRETRVIEGGDDWVWIIRKGERDGYRRWMRKAAYGKEVRSGCKQK